MAKSLEQPILTTLKKGPHATTELARAVHAGSPRVLDTCKRLERRRKVKSTVKPSRLFFFPVTGEVMSEATHHEIEVIRHHLRALFDRHLKGAAWKSKPIPKALLGALERYLMRIAADSESRRRADRIRSFRDELRAAASAGRSWRELKALIGLRPFEAKAKIWRLPGR